MDAYLDIKLLPDPEFAPNLLLNALFAKLHRALVEHGAGDIGISFPKQTERKLGEQLRLHGRAEALEKLMGLNWLKGMNDHISVGAIAAVPAQAQHRIVRRVQAKSKSTIARECRRLANRLGISEQQAAQQKPAVAERLDLPYLMLKSQSTSQQFRLFVEHRPVQSEAASGDFSAYGLSSTATVPWF
jgi:CRISPR-associated endonuclease Csy4